MTRRRSILSNPNGRSSREWTGSSADAAIPPRVAIRVLLRHDGRCAECGRKVGAGLSYELDHRIALANGGEHRENNLRPLCVQCHKPKTADDRKTKTKGDAVIKKRFGIKPQSNRGFAKTYKGRPVKHLVGGGAVYRDTGEKVR